MPVKRGADPSFIKPDPGKRIKREGGDGNISLSSIPMAPTRAQATTAPKFEGGDRKPLAPAPNFGGGNMRKRKFFGNSIKVRRGDDLVSAHFDRRNMKVEFSMKCPPSKKWSSVEVEQEIFERLNNAKFDIQPLEHWGFLDRQFFVKTNFLTSQSCNFIYICNVEPRYNSNVEKAENFSSYFKKEERTSQPKNERID